MKNLKKKLGKKNGFTLVEMLIVVAIIAVLVAVSIPLVNTSLEKARHAVDEANLRNAVSLMTIEYLTADDTEKAAMVGVKYNYVVDDTTHTGEVKKDGTGTPGKCADCKGTLKVSVDADGKATAGFEE